MAGRVFVRQRRPINKLAKSCVPTWHPRVHFTHSVQQFELPQINQKIHRVLFSTCIQHNRTHYDVLGIPQTATQKEIKEAYIKLGKECHPDLHQSISEDEKPSTDGKITENEELTKRFKLINEAYEVLSRKDTKRIYDLGLPGKEAANKNNKERRRNYSSYRTYDTFEERAGAAYGYKVDPLYWKRNPDKNKILIICIGVIILGFFIHYQIANLTSQNHSQWLDKKTHALNQELELKRNNAQTRGGMVKGDAEYEKFLAMYKQDRGLKGQEN